VNSLTGNLQRFGFDKVTKSETLHDIIAKMGENGDTTEELGNGKDFTDNGL
jgi:hypothetical protein